LLIVDLKPKTHLPLIFNQQSKISNQQLPF